MKSTALLLSGSFAILCLTAFGLRAQETPPAANPAPVFRPELQLSAEDRAILTAFVGHASAFPGKQTVEGLKAKCPDIFAWIDFRALNCLNIAYELTGDPIYLDQLRDAFRLYRQTMSTGPDEYLSWYGSPTPPRIPKDNPNVQIDEIQMNFRAIGLLARWIELARSNPAYAEANAATIKEYLALMEEHLYPKWDARGFYHDLGNKGGAYGGLDYPLEGRVTLSFEKLSIMVDGLLALHRVTDNPLYLRRALALGAWFKNNLSLKDGHYEWMSWCPAGKWDVSPDKPDAWKTSWIAPDPNSEWYVTALSIALNFYQHGLLFTDEDLQRFVKTQKERCWNGDLENPVYRTVGGVSGADNKYVKGRFLSFQIAHYDPVLTQLAFHGLHEAEVRANASSEWKGGINAQDYVREKYLLHDRIQKQPQPYRKIGERFLADPENRAYHERLFFEVREPGATTPLKPSEAGW